MRRSIFFIVIFAVLFSIAIFSEDIYKKGRSVNDIGGWEKIDSDLIYKIEIKRRDQKNVLKRVGDTWSMTAPIAADVDPDAVSGLLKGIEDMEIDTLISSKKEKRSLFQVDETGIEVTVYTKEDKKIVSFVIGKSAPDFVHTYVRKSDADQVYWAKGFKRYQFDKDTKMWRNRKVLQFNKDDAEKITLKSKDSAIVFQKEEKDWQIIEPERHKADKNSINTILNILSNFNAVEFEDIKDVKETSLDHPEFEAIVESKGSVLGKIFVGKEENNKIYIKNPDRDQILIIPKSRLNSLTKGIEDYKDKNKDKTGD